MAKRQTRTKAPPPEPEPDESELMLVRLELPKQLHQQFRVESAKEGRSMAKMARRLVEEWIEERTAR
jgi:hypothetical protein